MDHFFLHSAGGSVYNLGSFLDVSEALDLGFDALDRPVYAESPLVDGAAFGFESSGARTWAFPLVLPSGADGKSLDAFQAALRLGARPGGGKLVAHPFGVASSEAVHFDVLSGRWRPAYHARERGVGRTRGTLELDTPPFGYWPTMILLASAASVGGPGLLAVPGASVIGDVPGLAEIFVAPTTATSYGANQFTDFVSWSFGGAPSFITHWRAASAVPTLFAPIGALTNIASLVGDQFAPASQAVRVIAWTPSIGWAGTHLTGNTIDSWNMLTRWRIPASLEPAHRGRFRTFAWARFDVPTTSPYLPLEFALDAMHGTQGALASAAHVATLPPAAASGGIGASPAYSLLDLGEISLPVVASDAADVILRLWAKPATSHFGYATTATAAVYLGGLYVCPVDSPAGVLPRAVTDADAPFTPRIRLSAIANSVTLEAATAGVATPAPLANGFAQYRGLLPLLSPSVQQLVINLAGQTFVNPATHVPPCRSAPHFAAVSVRYRPRFTFTKSL